MSTSNEESSLEPRNSISQRALSQSSLIYIPELRTIDNHYIIENENTTENAQLSASLQERLKLKVIFS